MSTYYIEEPSDKLEDAIANFVNKRTDASFDFTSKGIRVDADDNRDAEFERILRVHDINPRTVKE